MKQEYRKIAEQLPDVFTGRMKELLGGEYDDFLSSYSMPRNYGLRVNTLKVSPEVLRSKVPFSLRPVPWIKEGYYYEEEDAVSRHPFYYAGLYYLQEPSAMTPASLLDVSPGMNVLDLCAAPGGKATALGAKLKGKGLLVANDISASRCRALLRNLELAGIPNAFVTNASPAQLLEKFPAFFDRILVDAPCSGEGMFRKDESLIRAWDPQKSGRCSIMQHEIIRCAAGMLRPGGKLMYSTCTFSPVENEAVIDDLLREMPEMQLEHLPKQEGFSGGFDGMDACVRLWPHRISGEGHFLALLRKKDMTDDDHAQIIPCSRILQNDQGLQKRRQKKDRRTGRTGLTKRPDKSGVSGTDTEVIHSFFRNSAGSVPAETFEIRKGQVYQSAVPAEEGAGIPFLRNGLYLGEIRKERFEPSQSLALAWNVVPWSGPFPAISLPAEDERLSAYLKGMTLPLREEEYSEDGWVLVAADSFPVGWGKVSGTLLKNKYPRGWRLS